LCSGIRYDQLPPIVVKIGTSYCLIDGFTRVKALKKRGQERWCFDVYEINEGFTLSELRDEIGLGANNHVVAKRATKADFIISGMQWVKLNDKEGKTISKKDIKNWLESIPNSFSSAQKTDIVNKIFDKAYPDCSVATFTESEASQYLEPFGFASKGKDDGDGFVGRTFAATINATHAPRNFCHALNDFFQHGKRTRINLFAPNGTKSKDVQKVIQSQKEEIEKWEKALNKYYDVKQTLIAQGQDFRLIEFGVRPSQLVDVDPDGGVVPLDD
jgi:Ca2+-binding EF-hand superfamily protein